MSNQSADKNTLYLIYDDECPLCRRSAHALNIKKAVGNLVLINARESHPLVSAAYAKGFDPDRGIVVIYNDQYYFGADATHFLAMLNSSHGQLNRMVASLFRTPWIASSLYPVIKFMRRFLLNFKGVGSVEQNKGLPLFARVFDHDWEKLSPLMKKRFSNRPYHDDKVVVEGVMNIKSSRWMRMIKPFLKLSGALIQPDGEHISVTVKFETEKTSAKYWFNREFKLTPPVLFRSYMMHVKDNVMVEFMRLNVGWRSKFSVKDNCVVMAHAGYVWRVFNLLIPLPINLLIGKCNVIECPLSDDTFSMQMTLTHFLWGKIYDYQGTFKIVEVILNDKV